MFACKHVLFFVTQIYSLLFCHADFADDADLFFFTQSFLRRCRRFFLNFRLVCPTRPGLGASALYLSLRPVTVGSGRVGQILLLSFTFPLGVPPDLESGVKKCPNLFRLCGFAIRSKGECISLLLCWGDYKSPGFNRSNLFLRRISNPPGRLAGLRSWLLFCYCIAVFIKNFAFAYLPVGREIAGICFQCFVSRLILYFECAVFYALVCSGIIEPVIQIIR